MTNETYVYTAKGEKRAKELGLDERKEGTCAMYGFEPVKGQIARAWLDKGYIRLFCMTFSKN